ncbi:helix-turn-helix domain-containing protein [Methylorubrum sp. SB2]|uniref:helix-turn-helix domain-containing protein n=1 Tax=Methylorubrum subtropicum TaxID=3138812 RepID=UPI00313B863B
MPPHAFTFSSTDAPDGFERYRDLYKAGSDAAATGAGFGASVKAHRVGRLLVFDRHLRAVEHSRDPARVRRDGFDHFTLQLLRAGRFHGGPLGDERRMRPGEVVLFDLTRPQRTRIDDARFVTVSIARDVVERAAPNARRHHGQPLPAAASGLLGDLMVSLMRRGATLPPTASDSTARALAELLAGTLAEVEPVGDAAAAVLATQRLERAQACIVQRLSDPRLDAEAVAAAAGLSRSVLYRLFEPLGGVAQFILARRVAALATALRNPDETRSITTLTYDHGFSSESHCSRAFRAVHGQPPGRFREAARAARPAGGDVMDAWFRSLA